ncbi:MAG: hypothetical protein JEZ00_15510 [Anaerolineaceae bacterium]|nr:hypothetical protein [Anaerolineaceae bacterium]
MKYLVLIADIAASRKIINRRKIQDDLLRILGKLNLNNGSIISPYTITLGDEFQAVFSSAQFIFHDVFRILSELFPEKVRFSFGIGRISTEIIRESSIGMDGPAFHVARDGIEKLKKTSDRFSINGVTGKNANLINQSLQILSHESNKWKESRLKTFNLYIQEQPVKKICESINLTDKAIYKTINMGMLDIFKEQLLEIEKLISYELNL